VTCLSPVERSALTLSSLRQAIDKPSANGTYSQVLPTG
jgi:hypothetical protein